MLSPWKLTSLAVLFLHGTALFTVGFLCHFGTVRSTYEHRSMFTIPMSISTYDVPYYVHLIETTPGETMIP